MPEHSKNGMEELFMEGEARGTDVILEFKHICKSFPGVKALDDVSFQVKRGRIHCLIGENGAGKSTMMKVINGMYKPDSGEIIFDGKPWNPKNSAQARQQGIAMIHQEVNIIPEMTILQNMYLGHEQMQKNHLFLDEVKMEKEAGRYLEQEGLDYDLNKKMKDISLAEAQMIEIIKAISSNAKIILMDEPTSSLTEKEVQFLIQKIFELKKAGITIIFISHKMEEIFEIADDISVFRDGKHIISGPAEQFTRASVIEKMVGREMKEVYPPRNPKIGDVLLRVEKLSRKGVFQDVSFEVHRGEILGISGLVGAGRTEIARSLIGLDPKDKGTVYCEGKELDIHNVNDSIRNGIAMVSEDRRRYGLVLMRNIQENISVVALKHRFKKMVIPQKKEKALVSDMMKNFAIKAPSSLVETRTLSGGNQQKVVLAKWMAVSPKVLIMDEPTRGIDVGTKYEIYKMMNQLTDAGMAIIMINSDMEELLGMSDRIIVICRGKVAGELSRQEANPNTIMDLAVGGNK